MLTRIARNEIFPHPHNKMWGKPASSAEAMKRALAITGDMEPIRVCACPGGFYIISGHSRFEACEDDVLECKTLEGLSEEDEVLRLITYNAGHAADRSKLIRAAEYCHRHFPGISIERLLDAAMVSQEREEWAAALKVAVTAIGDVDKTNKARSTKAFEKAAKQGPKALADAATKSLNKSGAGNATGALSSLASKAPKPIRNQELSAEFDIKKTDERISDSAIPENASTQTPGVKDVQQEAIQKETETASPVSPRKLLAIAKNLTRSMSEAGLLVAPQPLFAIDTILALLEGQPLPEAPSKAIITRLSRDLEIERQVANDNGNSMNAIVDVVNNLFRKAVAAFVKDRPRDGIISINARHLHAELSAINFQGLDSLDPEALQSRQDEANRETP